MGITTIPSTAEADEIMRLAVERFRTKMESSNRQFLQDRIDEIEAMNLPSEEEKLKRMCAYWPGFGDKSEDPWKDRDSVGPVRQHREQRSVTRLADVKTLYHMYMDGTLPPTLLTDEWRQMYLETLQSVCNEAAIRDEGDEDFEIPLCHELGSFIKYADGVHDPDFHRSGIAPFEPTLSIGIVNYTIKDSLAIYELPISRVREELKCSLQESLCGENFIDGVVDEDLNAYLYCRRYVEDSDPSHKDWAWRVIFLHADLENPTTHYGRKPRFDSIPEFLEWYSSWLEHLDLDELHRGIMWPEYDGDDDPWPASLVFNG